MFALRDKLNSVGKEGTKFGIYIHCNNLMKKFKGEKAYTDITPKEGEFIFLEGIKGAFKVEAIREMGHSVQYYFSLIVENPPKNYNKKIETINRYSTKQMNLLF